jgi:hypothetical protein
MVIMVRVRVRWVTMRTGIGIIVRVARVVWCVAWDRRERRECIHGMRFLVITASFATSRLRIAVLSIALMDLVM